MVVNYTHQGNNYRYLSYEADPDSDVLQIVYWWFLKFLLQNVQGLVPSIFGFRMTIIVFSIITQQPDVSRDLLRNSCLLPDSLKANKDAAIEGKLLCRSAKRVHDAYDCVTFKILLEWCWDFSKPSFLSWTHGRSSKIRAVCRLRV